MKITMHEVKVARRDGSLVALPDLVIPSGTRVAVVGPEGSGKTMMLRLIVGILTPESGELRYDGEVYVPQKDIAYQPQIPYFIPSSIRENMRMSFEPNLDPLERNKIIEQELKNVKMSGRLAERADKLTANERLCVALARTLIRERRCILLDCPFEVEDKELASMLEEYVLRRVKEMNATMITTHVDPKSAHRVSDMMIVINNSFIQEYGPTEEVFNNPASAFGKRYIESYL